MPFEQLGLRPELLRAVAAEGYTRPTPVQVRTVPAVLEGRDVLAGAQTGTGKTAAFTLPILQLLSRHGNRVRGPRALVLAPTRELAAQVSESVRTYGRNLRLSSTAVFGGVGIGPQIEKLRRGVDILVAPPGRLLDHAGRGTVDLSRVEILVLDEADRMLDMGFIHDIRRIMKLLPQKRQNMLFSATYSEEIKRLADGILHNPEVIEVAQRNSAAETVTHVVHHVVRTRKRELLTHLIRERDLRQVLVFTRTKRGADALTRQLLQDGVSATAIHGNKTQSARTRALSDFKKGAVRTLVATDVASRGLDIDSLPHVVNYDMPDVAQDYVHRIGRTGRAGASGVALSLVSADERDLLTNIQRLLNRKLPVEEVSGFKHDHAEVSPQSGRRQGRGERSADFRSERSAKSRDNGSGGSWKPGKPGARGASGARGAKGAKGTRDQGRRS